MEQINGHRVSLSHGVARGLMHGLISYGQSHEMIVFVRSSQNTWHLIKLDHDFGYRDFKRNGVSHPLHWEIRKHEMISRFGISATGVLKDRGSFLPCIWNRQNMKCEGTFGCEPTFIAQVRMERRGTGGS
jgi:hypothetical protein